MNDKREYKLIHTVDPTKLNIPIRERFAKLTLSSNKKKAENVHEEKPEEHIRLEKRQSASCNLLKLLNETEALSEAQTAAAINPLLRSDSSSSVELLSGEKVLQRDHDCDTTMDTLQVSEDGELAGIEKQIEKLSQKVSNISMKQELNSFNETQDNNVSIVISDSNAESDDEESIILISDSSQSALEESFETTMGFAADMAISSIDSAGSLDLPQEQQKEQLMAAFLKDVSREQRELLARAIPKDEEQHHSITEDPLTKAKILAAADTESMTVTDTCTEISTVPKTEPEQRLMPINSTLNISNSPSGIFDSPTALSEASNLEEQLRANRTKAWADQDTEVNTLSETLANEMVEISAVSNNSAIELTKNSIQDSLIISETSSEDISRTGRTSSSVAVKSNNGDNNSPVLYENAIPSPQINNDEDDKSPVLYENTTASPQINNINISVKMSVRIHMNMNASSDDETEEEDDFVQTKNTRSLPASNNEDVETQIDEEQNEVSENADKVAVEDEQVLEPVNQAKQKMLDNVNKISCTETEMQSRSDNNDQDKFVTDAERMLTEIYGNSWRTPQVLKTLKNASKSKCWTENDKRKQTLAQKKKTLLEHKTDKIDQLPEESLLQDFTIFRRNIEKTNLDSTRVAKSAELTTKKDLKPQTEPRTSRPLKNYNGFKTPSTPIHPRRQLQPKHFEDRFRQLVDSDSADEVNASDDSDIDETYNESASEHSWSDDSAEENRNVATADTRKKTTKIKRGNENTKPKKTQNRTKKNRTTPKDVEEDDLVYMDLTKDEVEILTSPCNSPPANHDANFDERLQNILSSCRSEEKTMLSSVKTKRKLFTPNFGLEDEVSDKDTPQRPREPVNLLDRFLLEEDKEDYVRFEGALLPPGFEVFNKPLESVKKGKPIFKITPTKKTPLSTAKINAPSTPSTPVTPFTHFRNTAKVIEELANVTNKKYSFLKSLDMSISKGYCDPEALNYRENYRQKREELAQKLYKLYNEKLFENKLDVPLKWNKKLSNTAGRCMNKKRLGVNLSIIELSEKVLTSADRLRCTLIHELCHAATWIFNGESGHGATWKQWARRANAVFPDLPHIGVCHQYEIEYKYTYKCTLCSAKSHAHSKSKKVENIRCAFCHGAIEVFLNKKDKEGNVIPTPVREPTGFAKFVKDNYKQHKQPHLKHADVMKILSNEFSALKVN